MLQLSDGDKVWVIDTRWNKTCYKLLKPYLEAKLIIGQNLKFDYKFLKFEGIVLDNIYDTFVAECILTNGKEWVKEDGSVGRELGLGHIANRYTGKSLDKSVRNQFIGLKGQPFTYKQIVYGSEDVLYLHEIREKQLLKAEEYDLVNIIELENKACLAIADIEYNGLKLDPVKWLELARAVDAKLPEYEIELDKLVVSNSKLQKFVNKTPQINLFGGTDRLVTIKWSSPVQALRVFNTLLGTKLESSGIKELGRYEDEYPLVKKFIDYKKDAKLATTYGDSFIDFINPATKRIHGNFWQILNTFRVSCGGSKSGGRSSVNLQNLPAKNDYLNCFIAEEGYQIIGIDYANQEARLAAAFSKDEVWLSTFLTGKDLHSEVCKMMFDIPDELVRTYPDFLRGKSYRDIAKTINFMALFGGTKYKLSKILQNSLEESDLLLKKYFKATNQLQSFLKKCGDYGVKNGYIRTAKPYSGIRWFPKWKPNLDPFADRQLVDEIIRASFNTPIQGSAGIITKLALVNIRKYIKDNNLEDKVRIVHVLHDAIYTEVITEFAEEFSEIQAKIMEDAGREFTNEIVLETDVTVKPFWSK